MNWGHYYNRHSFQIIPCKRSTKKKFSDENEESREYELDADMREFLLLQKPVMM